MHLQKNSKTVKGKKYESVLLVESYWDKETKSSKKKTISNLSKCPKEVIKTIEKSLKNGRLYSKDEFKIQKTLKHGTIDVLLKLSKKLKLDKILGIHHKELLIMVFNRLLKPRSKKGICSWATTTSILEILGLNADDIDHEKLYLIMDQLEKDKQAIEEELFKTRKIKPKMYLYDITSSYFEGKKCKIAKHGYSRDHRPDKKQIVIGLVTDNDGIPVSVEVFEGNTADRSTLKNQVECLRKRFGIESVTYVFDKGMVSEKSLEYITSDEMGNSNYITSITRPEILKIINNNDSIQISLFDKIDIQECIVDKTRYIICHNPLRSYSDKEKREKKIEKTMNDLEKLKISVQRGKGKPENYIIEKVTKILDKHYTKKYFIVKTGDKMLEYTLNENVKEKDALLDGKYAIKTTLDFKIEKEEVRNTYKNLSKVENAFKNIKNYLEIRPIYHYKDQRVNAHVFICFLAYYIQRNLEFKLASLLKDYTFYELIDELDKLNLNTVELCGEIFSQLTEKTDLQRKIYALIK